MSPERLFVTGGAGLLGRHVVAAARRTGWTVVAPTSTELDIREGDAVERAVAEARPTAIAHLAYRRDDGVVIVDGSAHVAAAAAGLGARLVHVSTDALFAGRPEPYTELDEPTPVHDYGRWKAEAERRVADLSPGAVLVRTSLMYASDGLAPCQLHVRSVLDGDATMRFFTDELRCFAHVDDVAAAVVRLAADPSVHGPLHVAGPDAIDRASFARHVARWLGRDAADVPTGSIADAGPERPAVVALDTTRARSLGLTCRALAEGLPLQRQR